MPPAKLPTSVLVALGLTTAACSGKNVVGPCLNIAVDTDRPDTDAPDTDKPDKPDTDEVVHPCLDMMPPDEVGPCLEMPPPPEDDEAKPGGDKGARLDLGDPVRAVLDRGVLPDDVAAILRVNRDRSPPRG